MMPEWMLFARAILALAFVVALIFLCGVVAKRMGLDKKIIGNKSATPRLSIVETLYLGPKHKLVIVRSGPKEHVLLLSPSGDLLVESYESGQPHAS